MIGCITSIALSHLLRSMDDDIVRPHGPGGVLRQVLRMVIPYKDDIPGRFYSALAQVRLLGRPSDLGVAHCDTEEDDLLMVLFLVISKLVL